MKEIFCKQLLHPYGSIKKKMHLLSVIQLLSVLRFFFSFFVFHLFIWQPLFSPCSYFHITSPQQMSLCSGSKSCSKLVSDGLSVGWKLTRERETDVEIQEPGDLALEKKKAELRTCWSAIYSAYLPIFFMFLSWRQKEHKWVSDKTSGSICGLRFTTHNQMCLSLLECCKMTHFTSKFAIVFRKQKLAGIMFLPKTKELPKVIIICTLFVLKKCKHVWN